MHVFLAMFSTQAPLPELTSRVLIDISCYAVLELLFRTYVYGGSKETLQQQREATVCSVFQEFMCLLLLSHYLVTGGTSYEVMNHFLPVMISYYVYDTLMAAFFRERFLTRQAFVSKIVHHVISIVALAYFYYEPRYLPYIVYYCVIESVALILAVRLFVNWKSPAWRQRLSVAYLVIDFFVRYGILIVVTGRIWDSAKPLIITAWILITVMMFNNVHGYVLSRRRTRHS